MTVPARYVAASAVVLLSIAACGSDPPPGNPNAHSVAIGSGAPSTTPSSSAVARTHTPSPSSSRSSSPPEGTPTSSPAGTAASLPRGGRTILGHYRVVAYYGGPDGPALGVLGSAPPEQIAKTISERAEKFAPYGKKLQPAMELITTVAQGSPGADGDYSHPIPAAQVQHYLDVAHRNKMLLILDFQPGRGEFLPQVKQFEKFLLDPSVSVALDPEWKMGPGEVPGQVIGSASAHSINVVQSYVSDLIVKHALPDKLLLVHQFTLRMLPDRDSITRHKGIELVFHADGFGSMRLKLSTWHALNFPGRPYGAGFKLFFKADTGLMSPAQVMALRPQPDVVTYQ